MEGIQELIDELIQNDVGITSLLRKAKGLTNTLHSPELDKWIDWELLGYQDSPVVPDYRCRFPAENWGVYAGPGIAADPEGGSPSAIWIRPDDLPERVKKFAETLVMSETVEALEAHGAEDDRKPWPPDMVTEAQEATGLAGGLFLAEAYQSIPANVYTEILDQVRHRLHIDLLNIRDGIPASEAEEGSRDVEQMPAVVNNITIESISGHAAVVIGDQAEQQVTTIIKNDIESLVAYLKEHGIGEDDLRKLREIELEEAIPSDDNYGPKLSAWHGNMLEKAKTGAWKVAVDLAPTILGNALKAFAGG